jgi:hypothetical protein
MVDTSKLQEFFTQRNALQKMNERARRREKKKNGQDMEFRAGVRLESVLNQIILIIYKKIRENFAGS